MVYVYIIAIKHPVFEASTIL